MAATATGRTRCIKCGKEKATSKCEGCSRNFCFTHLTEHRQQLSAELDEIEVNRDQFREILTQKKTQSQNHLLIEKINQWEQNAIKKIQEAAEEARESIMKHTVKYIHEIEEKLSKLTNQLQQSRQEDDITEIDLQRWKDELTHLEEQSNKTSNIKLRESSTPLANYIQVESIAQLDIRNISINAEWMQNGITMAGGNGNGNGLNQLYYPYGVYVHDDQTIYVADTSNHRIVEWKKGATTGRVVAGGNGAGNRNDQLNSPFNVIIDKESDCLIISNSGGNRVVRWPRRNAASGETIISNINCWGLAIDNNGYLYVSDINKQEVRRFKMEETNETIVAGGNGEGNRLNQLNGPHYIFVDQDHSVYVADYYNHRVMKWMKGVKEGIVVAGGQGQGNGMTQLSNPRGIFVDQRGTIYVADQGNHRVMRWLKGATEGSIIVGGNGRGGQANQLNSPAHLSFDTQNNLYVADWNNQRVCKFNLEL